MNFDNDYEVIYRPEDDEFRVYCNICDKFCIERYYKIDLKSGTHLNNFYKRQRLKNTNKNYLFSLKQMYGSNITEDYDSITNNCTYNDDDNNIIFKYLLFSIPSSILLFSVISLMIYTIVKTLFNSK